MRNRYAPFLFLPLAILCSCIGVQADITVRADGSGKILLEYRVSGMVEALGRLDGNESRQTVPVGRADLERTLERLPDMRLLSFSSREEASRNGRGNDIINKVELEFKNISALPAFLDGAAGAEGEKHAFFTRENGKNRLRLILLDRQKAAVDPDLFALVQEMFRSYETGFSLSADRTVSLATKPESVPGARIVPSGKKVSLFVGTGELAGLADGLELEFSW